MMNAALLEQRGLKMPMTSMISSKPCRNEMLRKKSVNKVFVKGMINILVEGKHP